MKRSEAAKKIQEYLNGSIREQEYGYQILDAVEAIGMLPPENKTLNRSTILAGEGNEWEEEEFEDTLEQYKDNYNKGYIDEKK